MFHSPPNPKGRKKTELGKGKGDSVWQYSWAAGQIPWCCCLRCAINTVAATLGQSSLIIKAFHCWPAQCAFKALPCPWIYYCHRYCTALYSYSSLVVIKCCSNGKHQRKQPASLAAKPKIFFANEDVLIYHALHLQLVALCAMCIRRKEAGSHAGAAIYAACTVARKIISESLRGRCILWGGGASCSYSKV